MMASSLANASAVSHSSLPPFIRPPHARSLAHTNLFYHNARWTQIARLGHRGAPGTALGCSYNSTKQTCACAATDQQHPHAINTLEMTPRVQLLVEHFYLPELPCSFPWMYHPDYENIKEATDSWVLDWMRPASDEERHLVVQTDYAGIICPTIPMSSHKERLLYVSQFGAWLTTLDDAQEDAQSIKAGNFRGLKDRIENVLYNRPTDEQLRSPAMKAIDPVLKYFRSAMSPRMHQRHLDAMGKFLTSVERQTTLRHKDVMPDLASYIPNRRETLAIEHLCVMIEFCLGVELDDETLHMKSFKELHTAATDYVAWANDIISFRKEYFSGDFYNLPSVIYFEHGGKMDFQDAVYEACNMIRRREADFTRYLKEVSCSEMASRNAELRLYLDNLPYYLSGILHWFYRSAKYHGVNYLSDGRREGWLQMHPDRTILTDVQQKDKEVAFP